MAENGTVAYVERLPLCDICTYVGTQSEKDSPRQALYDIKTRQGHWANACAEHRETHALTQTLGIGLGQMLVVRG